MAVLIRKKKGVKIMSMRPNGVLALAVAISRSGKSVWVKRVIEKHKRIIAFDPKGEYVFQMGFTPCNSRSELIAALKSSSGEARIAYVKHDKKEFDFFCDCAFNWNREAPSVVICEELANVTNSGKATGNWGRLVSQGLAYGPLIIGTVQRGQEVDNSIINNASFLHIGKHSTDDDAKYMAKKIGVSIDKIPREPYRFLQWNAQNGVLAEFNSDLVKSKSNKMWPEGLPRFRTLSASGKGRKVLSVGDRLDFKGLNY